MHNIRTVDYISLYKPTHAQHSRRRRLAVNVAATIAIMVTAACSTDETFEGDKQEGTEALSETRQEVVGNRGVQVGVRCQQEYQNGWQVDVGNADVWNRCGNFRNRIAWYEPVGFYYNLHGAKVGLEQPDTCGWACGYADAVDLFYMNTHGGSNTSTSFWAMWDQNSSALSSSMRLGASGRQNMIFATFACNTHVTDNFTWNRWIRAFAGGLVTTVGGRASLFAGNTQSGTELASRLTDGESVKDAWLESTWYADNANTPAQINTGANANDCYARSNTTLDTLFGTPILRDGAIGYMCWVSWN
jgi:hypothetical protein